MRAYRSFGAVDTNAPMNIANARAAGISDIDVYFFPCSYGKSIDAQVEEFYGATKSPWYGKFDNLVSDEIEAKGMQADLRSDEVTEEKVDNDYVHEKDAEDWWKKVLESSLERSFGIVWVDVETNPSTNCGWGTDFEKNCNFLTELVEKLQAKGFPVGIYLSNYMWNQIMGS